MSSAIFIFIILLSLAIAVAAGRNGGSHDIKDFLVASRQFGSFIFFFLAAGEIYSIGTMIGLPGGIYAKGPTYGIWFLGYILLAYPIGYFINPWIWRAANIYNAMTLPDLFRGHFNHRALELTVTITAIIFMIPWGQLQFTGLIVALNALGWHFNSLLLSIIAAILAFAYVALSGIRAPAMVSILKDTLLVLALVITGVAAASSDGLSHIFLTASQHVKSHMNLTEEQFSISTIVFQALGFYMFPFAIPNVFTARNEQTIRRTQIFMPLYMFMYPFLIIAAYYALDHHFKLASPNQALMAAAVALLPGWLLGLVAAGAALSGLLVLAGLSLTIGSMVTRNLMHGLGEERQKSGARICIVIYLVLSMVLALVTPSLMLTLINTAYYGVTQFFPGVMAIIFFRRASPVAIMAGIIIADVTAIALYALHIHLGGWNIGCLCLLLNIAIIIIGSLLVRAAPGLIPVARQPVVQRA